MNLNDYKSILKQTRETEKKIIIKQIGEKKVYSNEMDKKKKIVWGIKIYLTMGFYVYVFWLLLLFFFLTV